MLNSLISFGKHLQKSEKELKKVNIEAKRNKLGQKTNQIASLSSPENRIIILKDLLPIFCSDASQTDILKQWL